MIAGLKGRIERKLADAALVDEAVRAPGRELGRRSVTELLAALEGTTVHEAPRLVTCELSPGASTGPAPRR